MKSTRNWRSRTCTNDSQPYSLTGSTNPTTRQLRKNTDCVLMIHSAMRDLTRPCGISLCAPAPVTARSSRSLSPAPVPSGGSASAGTSPTAIITSSPLFRCASDRVTAKLERTNSVVGRSGGLSIALFPNLSPSQVLTIRRSWKHVNTKGLQEVVNRCFQKLERTNPSVLSAFYARPTTNDPTSTLSLHPTPIVQKKFSTNTMNNRNKGQPFSNLTLQQSVRSVVEHSRFFLCLLDRIIENDQDADSELKAIGARYVPLYESFGVGVPEIERLGEIIAETFFKLDGIRQSKETTKAWRILISQIIDHIRDGFETELRYQKRRNFLYHATLQNNQRNIVERQRTIQEPDSSTSTPLQPSSNPYGDNRFCKRNSMPSSRKASLRVEIASVTRKLSNL